MTDDPDYADYDYDDDLPDENERRRLFERAVPEVIRRVLERALESGVEKLSEGPENVRHLLGDLKLPKEALHYIYGQIDDTKKGLYRVVAKEIRDVLEHTNFSDEIADVLTKLSFEINTQIRFVPNPQLERQGADRETDADEPKDGEETSRDRTRIPRPKVMSKVTMKARDKADRGTKD
ncbi:MAG: hypothetical protein JRI23_23705 [Deltaproteobacteria bacterium]|jgi:hypothetical protein|nr:hypothetical protein [Deltaproteobacteria bacterium]MBW2534999.1 hypothetical protein [Deltaproteobacteria bacterium]